MTGVTPWRRVLVRAALASLVAATIWEAGSGAIAATPGTDLSALLALPPSSGWTEDRPGDTELLLGQFTAHGYAEYLKSAGTSPGSTEFDLNLYGFRDGYARVWEQDNTGDLLIERVFGFGDSRGAGLWYSDLRRGSRQSSEYKGDLATSTVPNSFGVLLVGDQGDKSYRVYFTKGNLMFVIHAGTIDQDLTSLAVGQGESMYSNAPDSVHFDNPPLASVVPAPVRNIAIALAAIFLVAVVAIVATLGVVLSRRRSALPAGMAAFHMSPDGSYWWDGVRWRDARVEIPPTAERSPDGAYWWDGATWRRTA